MGLRVWLAGQPFRLAPAWAVLCGALASGRLRWSRNDALVLLLAVILVDGLWGQVWTLLASTTGSESSSTGSTSQHRSALPYATGSSPAAHVGRWLQGSRDWNGTEERTTRWSELLLATVFCFSVAVFLGAVAAVLTAVAFLLALLSRLVCPGRPGAAAFQACFEIGLPWLLGHALFAGLTWSALSMVCGLVFVLWMFSSALVDTMAARVLLSLACAALLVCLIVVRQPVALVIAATVLLPTLAKLPWVASRQLAAEAATACGAALQLWWWAGMLVTAWALGGY